MFNALEKKIAQLISAFDCYPGIPEFKALVNALTLLQINLKGKFTAEGVVKIGKKISEQICCKLITSGPHTYHIKPEQQHPKFMMKVLKGERTKPIEQKLFVYLKHLDGLGCCSDKSSVLDAISVIASAVAACDIVLTLVIDGQLEKQRFGENTWQKNWTATSVPREKDSIYFSKREATDVHDVDYLPIKSADEIQQELGLTGTYSYVEKNLDDLSFDDIPGTKAKNVQPAKAAEKPKEAAPKSFGFSKQAGHDKHWQPSTAPAKTFASTPKIGVKQNLPQGEAKETQNLNKLPTNFNQDSPDDLPTPMMVCTSPRIVTNKGGQLMISGTSPGNNNLPMQANKEEITERQIQEAVQLFPETNNMPTSTSVDPIDDAIANIEQLSKQARGSMESNNSSNITKLASENTLKNRNPDDSNFDLQQVASDFETLTAGFNSEDFEALEVQFEETNK